MYTFIQINRNISDIIILQGAKRKKKKLNKQTNIAHLSIKFIATKRQYGVFIYIYLASTE